MPPDAALLAVDDLVVRYGGGKAPVNAVDRVSLSIAPGEVLGLVGESGCGKSSLSKAILRLVPSGGGRIVFDGTDITDLPEARLRPLRRRMQMVFQDPVASLNPRKTIEAAIGDPLGVALGLRAAERRRRVREMLARVGLRPEHAGRLPHEFSGGQRQRIGIARALALAPDFLICDEPVSALDVSVRAQILNLLADIRAAQRLAMLFISHDLSVVEFVADRVLVMYLGKVVEAGPAAQVFAAPVHPYTSALVASVPQIRGTRGDAPAIAGEAPSPRNLPSGCRFRTRCPMAQPGCAEAEPPLREVAPGRLAACHLV